MRKIVFILVLVLFTGLISRIYAQDIITLRSDGSEIRAKVTEVGMNDVKYKLYDNQSGPIHSLPKAQIFMIKYENGTQDVFPAPAQPQQQQQQPTQQQPQQPPFTQPTQTGQTGVSGQQGVIQSSYRPASDYRKGYAGIGFGGYFLTTDSEYAKGGIHLRVNFAYSFNQTIGLTGSYYAASYKGKNESTIVGSGSLLGALISFGNVTRVVEYDVRPAIGFLTLKGKNSSGATFEGGNTVFAFGIGGSVRWNVSTLISLSANLDYVHQLGEFDETDWILSSIMPGIGLNFRF